jgi:hypothetical protein
MSDRNVIVVFIVAAIDLVMQSYFLLQGQIKDIGSKIIAKRPIVPTEIA